MKRYRKLKLCILSGAILATVVAAIEMLAGQSAPASGDRSQAAAPCPPNQGCPPIENLETVLCDLTLIRDWPEREWPEYSSFGELKERMLKKHPCPEAGVTAVNLDLYLRLPAVAGNSEAGRSPVGKAQIQLFGRTANPFRSEDPRSREFCPKVVTVPRGLTDVETAYSSTAGEDQAEFRLDFVFVPRIFIEGDPGETVDALQWVASLDDGRQGRPQGPRVFFYPATAVPQRLFDESEYDEPSENQSPYQSTIHLPIDLQAWRQELEAAGIQFMRVILDHQQGLAEADRERRLGRLTFSFAQLRYFELVLNKKLQGRQEFDYVKRFRDFWKEVRARGDYLLRQDEARYNGIFYSTQPGQSEQ